MDPFVMIRLLQERQQWIVDQLPPEKRDEWLWLEAAIRHQKRMIYEGVWKEPAS